MPLKGRKTVVKSMYALTERKKQMLRGGIIDAFARIVSETPVDTGRARGNWFFTVGSPSSKVDEGAKSPSTEYSKVPKDFFKQPIFFTNNLPYIRRLEYGWSDLAPKGMVRVNLKKLRKFIKKI